MNPSYYYMQVNGTETSIMGLYSNRLGTEYNVVVVLSVAKLATRSGVA
jgi:hypothetical protein